MPVPHGNDAAGGNMRFESDFEGAGLLFGQAANGRGAANFQVMLADYFGALGGNQLGDEFAGQEGAGEIDDVWVAEKIVEEWFDRGLAIGAAELEQHYCDFFGVGQRAPLVAKASAAAIAVSGVRFLRGL